MPIRPFKPFLAVFFCGHVPCWGGIVGQVARTLGSTHIWAVSSSLSTGAGFQGKNTRFVIQGERGEDIKAYSAVTSEKEVLFKAGTRMRVTRESETKGGVRHIYVEEVD